MPPSIKIGNLIIFISNFCLKEHLNFKLIHNKIVFLMMYSMIDLFPLQVMGKLNLQVLNLWVFLKLSIFLVFLIWSFKHFLYVRIFKGSGIPM